MTHVKQILTCLALVLNPWYPLALLADEEPVKYVFNRVQLSGQFYSEGATYADLNRDGSADVIAGPYWYAGPDFTERFEIYDPKPFDINGYSNNFLTFAYDIDRDGWQDILVIGFPGKEAHWFENPRGGSKHWSKHVVFVEVDNESPTLSDLTGDGRLELVFHTAGQLGFAEIPHDDPRQLWQFRAISADRGYGRFNHGLGVGDVNGDGRADLLEKNGWWEQPAAGSSKKVWPFHPVAFATAGGAQMFAYDVDGDGDNDVVTSKAAHAYGLAWFENVADGVSIAFREHPIMGDRPEQNEYGVAFSQLHALAMTDIDGDGVKDIITGKRFWAHGGKDPGAYDPAVLYWFKIVRDDSRVRFIPHRIDLNSGVGTQVVAGDVNGDDRPDIVVGNKKGTFLFLQRAQSVDQQTGESQHPVAKPVKLVTDKYPYGGLSADEAARVMRLPNGFSVSVFAAEPDIKQPIAMTLDDRGRVWVAEAYEYPRRANGEGRDRILIFEDTNGDGRFDERKVFFEGLNLVSGMEVGFGGVWVGAAPYLLFISDRDGDDLPDGEPQVLLDGWGYQDAHETLNSFIWGPDGWLYGCHGVFTHSRVGRPGTPDRDRVPINAGVWRYHPTRHVFEVFAHGTSNPWGVDFDDHGQAICTACVIPHLYHVIQGARYQRQAGQHFNSYTYADIKTIADHLHFLGEWAHVGNGRSDQVGGGHAHAGAMIYLGGAWPAKYRNHIFMNNIHGQRINTDILERRGSGIVGHHGPDFLLTQDRASQMLNFRYGPDGQVYVIDWYDMQACHDGNADVHDRSNGRIYKVSYGKTRPAAVDLNSSSDLQLAELCLEPNDWYVRHARRILQERASTRQIDHVAQTRLVDIATTHPDVPRRLRAIWALHVSGQMTAELLSELLGYHREHVRAWAIQLLLDNEQVEARDFLSRLIDMAKTDDSPVVRLYLASAAGRLPVNDRWEILAGLASHAEDADDHNLPLMVWYAAEPLAKADPDRALAFGLSCGRTIPILREFMLRRIGSLDSTASLATLVRVLGESQDREEQLAVVNGIRHALSGQRRVEPPTDWNRVFRKLMESAGDDVRIRATALGVTFGDRNAMEKFRKTVQSRQAPLADRRDALEALLAANDPQLVSTLKNLLDDFAIRDLALRGLAQYDDNETPAAVLAVYQDLSPTQKRAALATLCARPAYAIAVLKSMAAEKVPVADLSADLVRQLHNLRNPDVDRLIDKVWGRVRTTPADKKELIVRYKRLLAAQAEGGADLRLGRAIYAKTCQQCHVLYGVGHDIGPDITGSNRSDVDYLLSNIVDPSALIAKEYLTTVVVTVDGRVVTGVVSAEDDKSVTLRNATETLIIPMDEIDERELSDTSIMPDDQLRQFSDREVASLFAYLMGKSQTPMLATKDTAALLFNGRDLAGWRGDSQLWSVDQGDIVGRSPGIDHNSFLISDLAAEDFRLTVEVKLVDNVGNSGIQFRSQPIHGFEEVRGYQADIGVDWWGKLYEENGRELLWDKSGEQHSRAGRWNKYEILAQGNHIRTWINGQLCVDLVDPTGSKEGIFGLQIHSGGPMEVRFRNLKLEVVDSVTSQ